MEIQTFRQSKLYRASAWLLVFARIAAIVAGLLLTLLFWFPRSEGSIRPPGWWIVAFLVFGGIFFTAILASVLLAVVMTCDRCGGRPTLAWRLKKPSVRPPDEWHALKDDMYPPELRCGYFKCEH